jgi:hypothetical protein
MNQIFRITEKEMHIDSLIIEPSSFCAQDCKDCYTRAHKQQGKQVQNQTWWELISKFFNLYTETHSTNQISLSINDPTNKEQVKTIETILAAHEHCKGWGAKKDTEFHLTIHSPSTIEKYKPLTLEWFAQVDSIYFSNIAEDEVGVIKELCALNKDIEIGWNCLIPSTITSLVLKELNGIHYIVNKSVDTGSRISEEVFSSDNSFRVTYDSCWRDYRSWKVDWHHTTCSANQSKFAVWPDGSVSGCPYAKVSNTGPAHNWQGILANIVKASKRYDFDNCPMKEIYG